MANGKVLFLGNLNDEEVENWRKFWISFNAWFDSDGLSKGYIKDEYVYYNSRWNGGTYECTIDFENEYRIEYGESFPYFKEETSYEKSSIN